MRLRFAQLLALISLLLLLLLAVGFAMLQNS